MTLLMEGLAIIVITGAGVTSLVARKRRSRVSA
jgi:hypothetical protein